MKFHSILAFCGISTLAAVYYCYYQYITGHKRKQTSANRFLASIRQESESKTHKSTNSDDKSSANSGKTQQNNNNTLVNPTPDIITDHLTTVVGRESTKSKQEDSIYDRGCEAYSVEEEEDSVVVKEVETVCSSLPLSSSALLQKTTVQSSNHKSCSTGTKQATACETELKANTRKEKVNTVQIITQSPPASQFITSFTTGQCTVESDTPIACDIVCELNTPSFLLATENKTQAIIGSKEASLDIAAINTIKGQHLSECAKMCDEVVSNPHKTVDKHAKGDSQMSAAETISKYGSNPTTPTEATINGSGDKADDLANGYISWASIVEETLKEHSDPVLSSDPRTDTPYVLDTSATNQSKTSPSTDNKNSNRSAHATESKTNKKSNKGSGANTYQKPQNNTGSSQGHSMTISDGRKMPGKNKQQQFSTSHYANSSNHDSAYKSAVTSDICNKQSPSSVSANDKNRHSPNSKNHNVNSSPSKNNSSKHNTQQQTNHTSPGSNQKANRQNKNPAESNNNRNATSLKNSLLSVDCNEANITTNIQMKQQKSSTPESNSKPAPASKSPADKRSNQENDPTGNAPRAKGDKKSGFDKNNSVAKNTHVEDCYNQHLNGSSLDQIYLNDPSVISVISPSNYSEADSAVISCGESSLASITYLPNGIPSPSGTSTDSGMRRSSGSPDYFNPSLEEYLSWEVEIPTPVGGKIIGKAGRNVKELRDKTGCKVIIKDIENSRRKQLLVVRGTLEQIQTCHRLLDKKFRKEIEFESGVYYTMEGLAGFLGYPMPPAITAPAQIMPAANTYLQLPQCAYFDAIVCNIQTAGHFFLQQPTHNSFYNLDRLHDCMRDCYRNPAVPELPSPITLGTISAAFLDGKWCRSQVVGVSVDENVITVRFLDVGGYREMPRHNVKQIRTDFLSLPFQATEVFLSEVTPPNDEADFSAEATKYLEELLAESGTPQALVKGWNMSDMPLVDLIVRKDGKFESVADLLMRKGYAISLNVGVKCL